mmetsp:Transcript_9157/g.26159  ORF Transcript_9157/g.26159 Transcript_9157/m.26159 type:complete len:202 (-) Transcript_9157:24-629(-)
MIPELGAGVILDVQLLRIYIADMLQRCVACNFPVLCCDAMMAGNDNVHVAAECLDEVVLCRNAFVLSSNAHVLCFNSFSKCLDIAANNCCNVVLKPQCFVAILEFHFYKLFGDVFSHGCLESIIIWSSRFDVTTVWSLSIWPGESSVRPSRKVVSAMGRNECGGDACQCKQQRKKHDWRGGWAHDAGWCRRQEDWRERMGR